MGLAQKPLGPRAIGRPLPPPPPDNDADGRSLIRLPERHQIVLPQAPPYLFVKHDYLL